MQSGGRLGIELEKRGAIRLDLCGRFCAVRGETGDAEREGLSERLAVTLDDGGYAHVREALAVRGWSGGRDNLGLL